MVPLVKGQTLDRTKVVVAHPLANPGDTLSVVDGILRDVIEFQALTVTTNEWAMLHGARDEAIELYHLPSDPRQTNNVADQDTTSSRNSSGYPSANWSAPAPQRNTSHRDAPEFAARQTPGRRCPRMPSSARSGEPESKESGCRCRNGGMMNRRTSR